MEQVNAIIHCSIEMALKNHEKRNEQNEINKQFTLELESNLISCLKIDVRAILVIFIITNNYHFER